MTPLMLETLMNRWRLIKKDPDAELSEPEEPLVYWVENSTPRKYVLL